MYKIMIILAIAAALFLLLFWFILDSIPTWHDKETESNRVVIEKDREEVYWGITEFPVLL